MSITGVSNYTNTYASSTYQTNTQTQTKEKGTNSVNDYKDYLTDKYESMKGGSNYSVKVSNSIIREAAGDEKTAKWLEENLAAIPKAVENAMAKAAADGSKMTNCSITINAKGEVSSTSSGIWSSETSSDKAKNALEEKLKLRREEKKAEEKKAAEKKAAKKAEEKKIEEQKEQTAKEDMKAVSKTAEMTGYGIDIQV